jgi:hypothetical protein
MLVLFGSKLTNNVKATSGCSLQITVSVVCRFLAEANVCGFQGRKIFVSELQ